MHFFYLLPIVESRDVVETQHADVTGEKDHLVDIPIQQQQEVDVTREDAENHSPHADDVISTHSEGSETRESGSKERSGEESEEGSGEESKEGADSVDLSEEDNVNEEVVDRGRRSRGGRGGAVARHGRDKAEEREDPIRRVGL
ncbi:hypothetical protein LIER_24642 [Lithospermum erythrorhizon]|uniref:Uncharacterized protein n=1 Tax=Lithospermum erythrorhizon TaxID=34254 RepID=A0AAV3R308_LITER